MISPNNNWEKLVNLTLVKIVVLVPLVYLALTCFGHDLFIYLVSKNHYSLDFDLKY